MLLPHSYGSSHEEIVTLQTKKREDRGGFADRRFVTLAEHPRGSMGEQYCLAQPEKYPEYPNKGSVIVLNPLFSTLEHVCRKTVPRRRRQGQRPTQYRKQLITKYV